MKGPRWQSRGLGLCLLVALVLLSAGLAALNGVRGEQADSVFAQAYGPTTSTGVIAQPTTAGATSVVGGISGAVASPTTAGAPLPPATGSGTDGGEARQVQVVLLAIASGVVAIVVARRLRRR